MQNRLLLWITGLAIGGGALIIIFTAFRNKTKNTAAAINTAYSIDLPAKAAFANENVPLDYFDVRESLDRELHISKYYQSQTIFYIKRANRFFPVIEPILKANGVPDDFKYLAVAESGLANVVSPSDAVGFWQFLKPTAQQYGLEVTDEVDERYNLEKATEAACKYLKASFDKYGNWTMAAASYNMGPKGVGKQIDRQNEKNYYNLLLNEETARYVFRILAIKLIIENPQKYGYYVDSADLYPPFDYSVSPVDTSINDIAQFAATFGTNYKMIKILNPWLRDNVLNNKHKKNYQIKIPVKGFRESAYKNDTIDTLKLTLK
jgi:hypothetical protein